MIFSFKLSYLEKVFMVYVLFSIDSITSLISVDSAPGVLLGLSSWLQSVFFLSPDTPARFARVTLLLYTKPILRKKNDWFAVYVSTFCFYILTRENNGIKRETPSLTLVICEFHQKLFLDQLNA